MHFRWASNLLTLANIIFNSALCRRLLLTSGEKILISKESPRNIFCKQLVFGSDFFDLSNICWGSKTQTNQLTAITVLILDKDSKKDNIQLFGV